MQLLCGEQWEAFSEVKAHLVTEYTERAGAGSILAWALDTDNWSSTISGGRLVTDPA